MRTIYLIRHGEPAFPNGERVCLSTTDLPLSAVGRMQGVLLESYFSERSIAGVYHSGMARSKETAKAISDRALTAPGFQELHMGIWEGLPFREIRSRYPDLYEQRGNHPGHCQSPGGELPAACSARARMALGSLLAQTEGDLAVVAHAGLNRLLLCDVLGLPLDRFLTLPQPYGCVNLLHEENGCLRGSAIGLQPHPRLSSTLCQVLLAAAGTPDRVCAHCRAVAEKADLIARQLAGLGLPLDREALYAAALLHDIARAEPDHAATGACWLTRLGYPEIGALIASHHDLGEDQEKTISEAAVLYLADKLVEECREVTIDERFLRSLYKCRTETARAAHLRRYHQAKRVEQLILDCAVEKPCC